MCSCGQDVETATHFLLHCPNHHCTRKIIFRKINQASENILRQSDCTITKILLLGDNELDYETKTFLLVSTIKFISLTGRLSFP